MKTRLKNKMGKSSYKMRKRKKDEGLAQFKDYLFIKIIASDLKIILAILVQ